MKLASQGKGFQLQVDPPPTAPSPASLWGFMATADALTMENTQKTESLGAEHAGCPWSLFSQPLCHHLEGGK